MADEVKNQEAYIKAWTDMMVDIWQEKIAKHNIVRTGALMGSFSSTPTANSTLIKWAGYGIYQAFGTGRGYARGNGGYLYFLDPEYRKKHKLGKPRKRRNWYSHKLYSSIEVFKRAMSDIYAHDVMNTIIEGLK